MQTSKPAGEISNGGNVPGVVHPQHHPTEPSYPIYVWELPVRVTHWVNFICIGILTLTGIFIEDPYLPGNIWGGTYLVGTIRIIHFITAFVFTASVLLRFYWLFKGNKFSHWNQFLPLRKARRRGIRRMMLFYTFIRPHPPAMVGHNPLAGTAYSLLFILFIIQVITGFALYSVPFHGGFWPTVFGWIIITFGVQSVKLVHFIVMWLILAFVVHHVYTAILIDIEERSGLVSSIFTGFKIITPTHLARAEAEDMLSPISRRRRGISRRRDNA